MSSPTTLQALNSCFRNLNSVGILVVLCCSGFATGERQLRCVLVSAESVSGMERLGSRRRAMQRAKRAVSNEAANRRILHRSRRHSRRQAVATRNESIIRCIGLTMPKVKDGQLEPISPVTGRCSCGRGFRSGTAYSRHVFSRCHLERP